MIICLHLKSVNQQQTSFQSSDQDWATKHLTEPYNKILSSFSPLPRQHCIASARCNFKLWWSLPFPWLVCLHQRIVWTTFRRELWRPDIVWHSLLWRRSKLSTDYWLLTTHHQVLVKQICWASIHQPDWGSSALTEAPPPWLVKSLQRRSGLHRTVRLIWPL